MAALTVRELIAALEHHPDDAYVLIEGCDCIGFAGSVSERRDTVDKITAEFDHVEEGRETVTIYR